MSECKQQTPIRFGPIAPSLNSLRGIRYFSDEHGAGGDGANGSGGDGGNGDGGNGDGGNSGGGNGGGGNSGGSNDQQQQGQTGGGQQQRRGRQESFSPEYVSELRQENARRRQSETTLTTRAETAEREREEARIEAATLRRERAIERIAPKAGANPDALLDSAAFARATKDLDLADPKAVQDAIEAFVKDNPHVSATPAGPGSSGAGRPGGSTSERPDTSNSLAGAVTAALTPRG
jgi:hypothetical protein